MEQGVPLAVAASLATIAGPTFDARILLMHLVFVILVCVSFLAALPAGTQSSASIQTLPESKISKNDVYFIRGID